ncbi:MAG: hypothetical protein MMC33_002095 [Icmadophila ericetorum]|nr:hypothetical protein [Icmadophila ericetorum]
MEPKVFCKISASGNARLHVGGQYNTNNYSGGEGIQRGKPTLEHILKALFSTDPDVDKSELLTVKGRVVEGTCAWLTSHKRYKEWLSSAKSHLLWLSGGPGSGKTMAVIHLIDILQSQMEDSN